MAAGNGGRTVRLPAVVTLERDDLGEVDVARCLAVEVASHGDTHEEALANLREALERAGFVQVSVKGSHCKRCCCRPSLEPARQGLGQLGPWGSGGRPAGDHLGVGADQDGATGADADRVGGRPVQDGHLQWEGGGGGLGGLRPGPAVGAGQQGQARAEEVQGRGPALAVGQPGVGEAAVEVLG
jgi:hypothetical protein